MLTFKFCVFSAPEASFPFAIDLPRIVSCLAKILSIVKITKKIVKIRGKMFAKNEKRSNLENIIIMKMFELWFLLNLIKNDDYNLLEEMFYVVSNWDNTFNLSENSFWIWLYFGQFFLLFFGKLPRINKTTRMAFSQLQKIEIIYFKNSLIKTNLANKKKRNFGQNQVFSQV